MNNSGHDYIMIHDIVLFESAEDFSSDPYYRKTQTLQLSQINSLSDINIWKPIINNAFTNSFRIDYVLRLHNTIDNSQIWKYASITISGDDVSKFGTYNTSINISQPIVHKIYNKKCY